MSLWKLKIDGVESTLQDLGIQQFDLQFQNLGEDTLHLSEKPGQLNATPIMAYGATVQLIEYSTDVVLWDDAQNWDDATPWAEGAEGAGVIRYIGTCTTNPRIGMPGQLEARAYTCKNIIWDLNRMVYEQDWHEDETNTYFKGRVNLGRNASNTRIDVSTAMQDVIGYAQNAGLSFTTELPTIGIIPPDQERVDVTCWEALKALLIWSPGIATSVDYSTGTPEINVVSRSAATSATYTATELQALQVTPRNDLKLDGVVLNFELTSNIDGETVVTMQQDTAGTTTGTNILRQTIDLYGIESSSTTQQVDVVVEDPGDPTSNAFWLDHVPGLAQVTDLEIVTGSSAIEEGAHPNRLVSGQIMEWMEEDWAEGEYTATISFKFGGKKYKSVPVAHTMVLTTATTKTYSQLTSASYTPPEEVPTGLAASLLADRSQLHYEGALALIALEPDWTATTTNVCNILPGGTAESWDDSAAWDDTLQWLETIDGFAGFDAINAVIETIRIVRTANGKCTTSLKFGPPEHLGPQDFISMVRATRDRTPSEFSRAEPEISSDGTIHMSGTAPQDNSNLIGGGLPEATQAALLVYNPATGTETWEVLNKGTENQQLTTNAAGAIVWDDPSSELPTATKGDIIYKGDTDWATLSPDIAGYHLASTGTGITWEAPPESELPPGDAGDITYRASSTSWVKLPIGTDGYKLTVNGTTPAWVAPELPTGSTGDLLQKSATGWDAVSLATALGLSGSGMVYFNGTSFELSNSCSGGYTRDDVE